MEGLCPIPSTDGYELKIVNMSLNQQHVPLIWRLANITPIPKESPLVDYSLLRPISLTNIIIRIVERIIFEQEISSQAKMLIDKYLAACV